MAAAGEAAAAAADVRATRIRFRIRESIGKNMPFTAFIQAHFKNTIYSI
jgi:hypothetical protein